MTTSSDQRTESPPHGDHWLELTATLSRQPTEEFGQWIDDELQQLEADLHRYVTPGSCHKSLMRSRD